MRREPNVSMRERTETHVTRRSGLTLVEVMIATTLTLLLMLALAQGFKTLSETVSEGRTKLALSDELRNLTAVLREDLDRCTVTREIPQTYPGPGYFKYYDGPMWDATGLQYNYTPGEPLLGSRFGDLDDIIMFTAQANPGEVFRGTVPQALMIINQLNAFEKAGKAPGAPDVDNFLSTINGISPDQAWRTEVTIESDYAEIIWFMLPLLEGNRLPVTTPPTLPYIEPTVTQTVVDVATPLDGMPDKIALCRRVLPIRRDIDLNPSPVTPAYRTLITNLLTHPMAPKVAVNPQNAGSFRICMFQFYQRCDLSLRPQNWQDQSGSFLLSVAANSLEDLQLPENRFAHFTYPVDSVTTTLPILALTSEQGSSIVGADTATGYRAATNPVFVWAGINNPTNYGFMPPYFLRSRFDGTPMFTEIVATNVIAFDVKAFDPAAKLLAHPGTDRVFGDAAFSLPGLSGFDDAAVGPSDPGYGSLLAAAIGGTAPIISSQGAYCDMGWGFKLHTHPLLSARSTAERASVKEYFRGDCSGIVDMLPNGLTRDAALNASGAYYNMGSLSVYQPVYDSYTNFYEFDGEKMEINGGYWYYRGGLRRFGFPVAAGPPDDIADGVKNPRLYVDAFPPAPFEIPSVKVMIRVQDLSGSQLQQMSVVHSFPK